MSEALTAPVVEATPAPVAAPVVEATPAPAAPVVESTPAPVAEPVAPVEAPAATPVEIKPHTDEPTAFEQIDGPKEPPKPEGEVKPEDAPKPVEIVPEPVVYALKMPEGFTESPAQIEAYTGALKEFGVSPEAGQKLLEMHAQEIAQYAANTLANQHKVFSDTRREWRDAIAGDAEIGGSGFETAKRTAARGRDLVVNDSNAAAFDKMLRDTGVGDHPEFWRVMYRVGRLFDEPTSPPPNATPSPNGNPAPARGVRSLFNRNGAAR